MTQIKYWVIDPREIHSRLDAEGTETRISFYTDSLIMSTVLDENEVFEPPPPVRHGIETLGWRVLTKVLPPSGLNDMASVDWKTVADALADAMQVLLDQEDLSDQTPTESAGSAMDNYQIAQHEEALRNGPEIVEVEREDDDH